MDKTRPQLISEVIQQGYERPQAERIVDRWLEMDAGAGPSVPATVPGANFSHPDTPPGAAPRARRGKATVPAVTSAGGGEAMPSNSELRQWAAEHGMACPSRGRIPGVVRTAFAEHRKSTVTLAR